MSSLLHHILEKPTYTLHYVWDICFYHIFPTILILPDTLLFQLFFQLYRVFKQPIKKTSRRLLPSMRVFSWFSLGKIIFWLQVFWTLYNTKTAYILHTFYFPCINIFFIYISIPWIERFFKDTGQWNHYKRIKLKVKHIFYLHFASSSHSFFIVRFILPHSLSQPICKDFYLRKFQIT